MALRIVDGVPGAGKTYYMVNWLCTSDYYLELSKGGWMLNPEKKVRIITNIDGLKLQHEKFDDVLSANGGFGKFFTREFQEKFSADCRIIYILDEAQQWFRPKHCKLTHENLLFFEWLRHDGVDLWLLVQDARKIDIEVRCLAERIVSGQARSLNISKELTYHERTFSDTLLCTTRLIFSKKIASQYKSSSKDEAVKITNPLARKFFAALAVTIVVLLVSGYRIYSWWDHKRKSYSTASAVPSSPAAASGSVAPAGSSVAKAAPSSAVPSAVSGLPQAQAQPQVEYYMYQLDYVVSSRSGILFLLGTAWVPKSQFPYQVIKKGSFYFAMIPVVLLPALENGSRALPIRTGSNSDKG